MMTKINYTIVRNGNDINLEIEAFVIPSIAPLSRGGFDPGDPPSFYDVTVTDQYGKDFPWDNLSTKECLDIDLKLEEQAIKELKDNCHIV